MINASQNNEWADDRGEVNVEAITSLDVTKIEKKQQNNIMEELLTPENFWARGLMFDDDDVFVVCSPNPTRLPSAYVTTRHLENLSALKV